MREISSIQKAQNQLEKKILDTISSSYEIGYNKNIIIIGEDGITDSHKENIFLLECTDRLNIFREETDDKFEIIIKPKIPGISLSSKEFSIAANELQGVLVFAHIVMNWFINMGNIGLRVCAFQQEGKTTYLCFKVDFPPFPKFDTEESSIYYQKYLTNGINAIKSCVSAYYKLKKDLRFITVEDLFNERIISKVSDTLFNKFKHFSR